MPTSIDSLQIEINANATKANDAIDRLCGNIDKLSNSFSRLNTSNLTGLANGVQKLGTAMQGMNNVKTADFTRLANNITKLGNINVSALNSAASSMSHLTRAFNQLGTVSQNAQAVGEMAKNLSKLGGANVQRAITNIPQLATAMNGLMTTLSRSPRVSQNVIQMTNALANLASQGRNVGSATNTLTNSLNRTHTAMRRTSKSSWSLVAAFGKFYANCFLLIRGIKGLWNSIEGTADYIEAFNYFNVAFGKISSEWNKDWEKFGYENAEAYANSFTERMSESLGKLSGIQIDLNKGLLSDTGMKNLGLNIQEITQYASQLASVTNSVGQTGEVSLAAANIFTKLGADISSLFNIDYSSVMGNLQSGLIGQSRALYKYGIDITNATLQTYAYGLGIEKAVSEMTQAEKMQLRMIAILDQSKVAWGDLANTINSPSNMIRQFTNNLKETGMVLGQLFIPLLEKVLPIINGVTIAIKRLLSNIAGFLGIKIDFSSFGQGYSEDIDGVTDSFDDATSAVNKFKTTTLGIDELNINDPQQNSGSGSGAGSGIDLTKEIMDAAAEYEKVWDEAFAKMESKAQAFADKFSKIFQPIEKLFKDISIGDWFAVGGDVSDIAIGIFDFFSDALKKVNWKKIGNNIGDFLSGIKWKDVLMSAGNFFETLVDSAIDLWKGSFETAPIETAIITALAIAQFTGLNGIIASKIASAFPATLSVGKTIAIVGLTFTIGFDVGKEIGKLLFPEDAEYYENFSWFGENGFFSSFTDGSWKKALKMWGDDINKWMEDTFGDWAGTTFSDAWEGVKSWWSTDVVGAFKLWGADISNWWTEDVIPWFTLEKWLELLENIKTSFSTKWSEIKEWWNTCALVLWWTEDVMPWFTAEKWSELWENVKESFSTKWSEIKSWWASTAIAKWWKEDVQPWFTKKKWEDAMIGVKEAFENTWNNAISSIKQIWNAFATWLNEKLVWTLEPVVIAGKTLFPGATINLGRIPTFQTGGFPEDGLFMANHNELVGQFSNGKTAVANNEQIVAGIEGGVERAVTRALEPYLADIVKYARETAEKEMSVNIGDRDIARANARGQRSLGYSLVT